MSKLDEITDTIDKIEKNNKKMSDTRSKIIALEVKWVKLRGQAAMLINEQTRLIAKSRQLTQGNQ